MNREESAAFIDIIHWPDRKDHRPGVTTRDMHTTPEIIYMWWIVPDRTVQF